jgi:RNA polymerase sigma-70 factor (ECF subfamily)
MHALLQSCRAPLERHIQLRLGAHLRRVVEVEDVYQESVAEALASLPQFRGTDERCLLKWLKGIAEHVILNLARRRRIDRVLYVDHEAPASTPTPSKAMRRENRGDRLQAAIDTLPAEYREAVLLVRIEGLPIQEAARRMNRTAKAVMHLLGRALAQLKDHVGNTESLSLPRGTRLDGGANDDH